MTQKNKYGVAIIMAGALLAGCGQTGPLFHPEGGTKADRRAKFLVEGVKEPGAPAETATDSTTEAQPEDKTPEQE